MIDRSDIANRREAVDTPHGVLRLLILEDSPADMELEVAMLEEAGFACRWERVETSEEFLGCLQRGDYDLILADYRLPTFDGLSALRVVRAQSRDIPFILVSGAIGEESAIEALKTGATDYVLKTHLARLVPVVRRALQQREEQQRRREAEEALKRYATRLEDANRIKELCLDMMRHDLLNPASAILGAAEMLEAGALAPAQEELTRVVKRQAEKMVRVITNATLYSRLECMDSIEREPCDLNAAFRAVVESVKPLLERKRLGINYLAQDECYAKANRLIESVFSNLLENAIKFSPEGRQIEVNIVDDRDRYTISVKDWGDGIAAEDKSKLFARFERVDKRARPGTGLGLAIVKRIVDLHHGRVWVEDNAEGGSVFFVQLPKSDIPPGGSSPA